MVTDLDKELWESLWSCDGEGTFYWCDEVRKTERDEKGEYLSAQFWLEDSDGNLIPNPHDIALHDSETGVWHEVTLAGIREAYYNILLNKPKHCGGEQIDIEDPDSCFEDYVLQYAIFGELVYG